MEKITITTTVIIKGDSTQYSGWPFAKCFFCYNHRTAIILMAF